MGAVLLVVYGMVVWAFAYCIGPLFYEKHSYTNWLIACFKNNCHLS
jgi:hypothetical protein